MSRDPRLSVDFPATMSILRLIGAVVCLCGVAISAPAQTIEIPHETRLPVPLPPQEKAVSRLSPTKAPRTSRPHLAPVLPEMVDVAAVDPTIVVDLKYATEHNVTGHQLYRNGMHALVLPSVAQQLAGAQTYLKQFKYRLKIWDAYRPKQAQELLWKYAQKDQYVANPERGFGSMHSYGVAVDLTLVDDWTQDAKMPTQFDEFTPLAMMHYTGADPLVRQHLNLLQKAMSFNNFYGLRVEWWHFTSADWKKFVPYWEDSQLSQAGDSPSPKS